MCRGNTFIILERWSVEHEVSSANILYGLAEVRDVGSMAVRRAVELANFDYINGLYNPRR